eukprot:gene7022-8163_t
MTGSNGSNGSSSGSGSKKSPQNKLDQLDAFDNEDVLGLESTSLGMILQDIQDTFPSLLIFQKSGPLHNDLIDVLGAYICNRPDIGYVPGMTFLGAMFLLNMEKYDAFQLDWITTLFSKALPLDIATRVWDLVFIEGEIFIYRTSLAILRYFITDLETATYEECIDLFTRLPQRKIHEDQFFEEISSIILDQKNSIFGGLFIHVGDRQKTPPSAPDILTNRGDMRLSELATQT